MTELTDDALVAFLDRFDELLVERPEAALDYAASRLREAPDQPDVATAYATALWEVEGPGAARRELEMLLEKQPEFADAHYLLWSIAEEADDLPAMVRHGLRVLALDREADEVMGLPPPEDEQFLITAAEAVLQHLPELFRNKLAHVPVLLEPRPDEDVVRDGLDPRALGLFDGPAAEAMTSPDAWPAPTRIVLYSHCLLDAFGADEESLRDEVEITLLHEIGHYFGLDEEALERLGLG